jgi:S-adenosylmethionine hydrolase
MVLRTQPEYVARHLTANRYFRPTVSQTFHGRDVFAPVAGYLAIGVPAENFGPVIQDPVLLPLGNRSNGFVLSVDRFGNIITSFVWDDIGTGFKLTLGATVIQKHCRSYSEARPGELFAIKGSGGFLEVSMNRGNAASALGIGPGAAAELRWV